MKLIKKILLAIGLSYGGIFFAEEAKKFEDL